VTLWRRILAFFGIQRKPKRRVCVRCSERIRREPDGTPRHLVCGSAEVPPIIAACEAEVEL